MSNFLTNLARRGAGLAPQIAPRVASIPAWSPAASSPYADALDRSREGSAFDPGLDDGTAHSSEQRITTDFVPGRAARPPTATRSTLSRGPLLDDGAKIPDIVRPVDPAPHSDERSGPLRPPAPIVTKVTTAHVGAPAARAEGTPATGAHTTPGPAPSVHADPQALRPRTNAVAVEPHAGPDAAAAWRQPVMTLPQAKSENHTSASLEVRPTVAAREPPRIQVRIGKVEVRASPPVAPPTRAARPNGSSGFSELRLARAHLDRSYR
jgi:hypothetical protein